MEKTFENNLATKIKNTDTSLRDLISPNIVKLLKIEKTLDNKFTTIEKKFVSDLLYQSVEFEK